VIYVTNLEITNFNVESDYEVNIVAQYLPYGQWNDRPCYVLMLSVGNGEMLVLTLDSKNISRKIVDTLDKLNHQSFLHKDNMHTCVTE